MNGAVGYPHVHSIRAFSALALFVSSGISARQMSNAELSILIIDENRIRATIIEDGLREAGHTHVAVIHDVNEVGRTIKETMPDVFVIDLENPKRDMLEHFFTLSRAIERPIAMFVDRSDGVMIEKAVAAGVSAYVVDGLKKERVKPIMDMAISRFNAFARLRRELEQARSELEDRKLIDQAKAIIMRTRGLSEADAYSLLRTTAMNQNRRMVDIAQSLITAADLLGP
jgi:two-component system, response regulator / RNA-binding antiterminator